MSEVRACLFLLVIVVVVAPGCTTRQQLQVMVENMRTEYMHLEDRYIDLDHKYRAAVQELQDCQEKLEASDENKTFLPSGEQKDQGNGTEDVPELDIDSGAPPLSGPDTNGTSHELIGTPDAARSGEPDDNMGLSFVSPTSPLDKRVTHIVLDPYLTSGHNFDGKPGDDGIAIVIETRNADDLFVPAAGNVTVSLLDPAEQGEQKRMALWRFGEQEIQQRIKNQPGRGRGIVLKLPWQKRSPRHTKLLVFVRFETVDGRQLEASSEINVAKQGDDSARWAQRTRGSRLSSLPAAQPDRMAKRPLAPGVSKPVNQAPPFSAFPPRDTPQRQPAALQKPVWRPHR